MNVTQPFFKSITKRHGPFWRPIEFGQLLLVDECSIGPSPPKVVMAAKRGAKRAAYFVTIFAEIFIPIISLKFLKESEFIT